MDPESLQRRLDSIIGRGGRGHAAVAVGLPGGIIEARAGRAASQKTVDGEPTYSPGCTAKLFTAMLAAQHLAARSCSLDIPVHGVAGPWQRVEALDGTTVRELLEHRHGIDDSAIDVSTIASLEDGGRTGLYGRIAGAPRLHAAGRYYSYSQIGHMLVAAILERITGLKFQELLSRELFTPLGIRALLPDTGRIAAACPATGDGLRISLTGMVRLLLRHGPVSSIPEPTERAIWPLPGWHPVERGIVCGWKAYANGWLGHQSIGPGTSMLVRVNHEQNVAVGIAAEAHAPGLVAARLLGDVLPELRRVDLPRSAISSGIDDVDLARIAGQYSREALRLTITARNHGQLSVACSETRDSRESGLLVATASAVHDGGNVFLLRERHRSIGAFVQPIDENDDGFSYLWNGQCLFVRLRSDDSGSRTH